MRVYIFTTEEHGILGVYESRIKAVNAMHKFMTNNNDELVNASKSYSLNVNYYYGKKDTATISTQDVY
tara:strand:- start:48 stop:251 length:204 start_codon:yes stop_codon:yes gene_type:complete